MKILPMLAVVLVTVAFPIGAGAQTLQKCVDANGKVTYSDRKCAGEAVSAPISGVYGRSASSTAKNNAVNISPIMKMLYACERGEPGACLEKDMMEKRCESQRKTGIRYSDCKNYGADKNEFNHISRDCKVENKAAACAMLSCIAGSSESCDQANEARAKREETHDRLRAEAAKQGLPSGSGWYMNQNWRDIGNGAVAAIVTCSNNSDSVVLRKTSAESYIVMTSVTGSSKFFTIDDAARNGCANVR